MSYHGRFEQQKQPKDSGNQGKKGGKGLKVFLIVLAVLLALILIAAALGYWFIQNKFSKMNVVTLPEDTYVYTEAPDEYTRPPETEPEQAEGEATEAATVETTIPPMSADDIINILVVGQAARAERSLDGLAEDGQLLGACLIGLVDAEDGAVFLVLGGNPGH